jgi:LPS-assembly protein
MRKLKISRISLAVLCALPLAAGAQQELKLKLEPTLTLTPPSNKEEVPLFLDADRLRGHNDRETEAEGNVRMRTRGQAVHADRLRHDKPLDEITAEGKVRIERGTDVVEGTRLQYSLETERGFMDNPSYTLHKSQDPGGQRQLFREADARGTAEHLLFEGADRYRVRRAEYTACAPGNDDWYLRAGELTIDKSRDLGEARDATIVFMGTPIFYSPYLSFSLHQERKSGFITPHYGSTNTGGAELTIPYYWNIAPNRDATISPRVMTRRGVLVDTEFRYLEPTYAGEARVDVLPDDRARDNDRRWAYSLRHNQAFSNGWSGALNLLRVSDNTYFTDLSTQIALTSQVQLPSDLTLGRSGAWGSTGSYWFSGLVQNWQTLQPDPLAPVTPAYNRLPQLTVSARQDVKHSEFDFYGQYVGFDHPTLVNGQRTLAYPSFSLPLQTAYAYVTPKLGLNVTRYSLDPNTSGYESQTRTLPIFTVDSGMVFERPTSIGGASFVQTLEPRLYYVNIPYRDQNSIPVFDSGQQDIRFSTIYTENQFTGWDRINDANQMTLGIASRLIAADTGSERLSGAVAQRFYFETQRVGLPGVPVRTSTSSDLLAALTGTIAPHWTADVGWQFTTSSSQTQRFDIGTRYQPQPGKVLNLSYRETKANSVRQTDVSTQWPVSPNWTALARWNYSLLDNRTLEGLAGVEYNGDCWALRAVAHRFAVATQQTSTTFFIQLELNGVSRIGSNPMETLRRNISGYTRLDPRAPRPDDKQTPYY